MTNLAPAIETKSLSKQYKGKRRTAPFLAVDELSFRVEPGTVFGFLGPNGAGKTTTINMLLGNIHPTSGAAYLLGKPIGDLETRRRVGFLPEKFQFHDFLTADEFLDLHGRLYGMSQVDRRKRIPEVLEMVGLSDRRNSKLREFSKGMQQRAGLAQAILNDPDLVILDEPTSALDPMGRREVRDIVTYLRSEGKTVLLNSHLLSEIEMVCDQVAIIKSGKVMRLGAIDDLVNPAVSVKMRILGPEPSLVQSLTAQVNTLTQHGDILEMSINGEGSIPELVNTVVQNGGRLVELTPMRESLEDLFIRVVDAPQNGVSA